MATSLQKIREYSKISAHKADVEFYNIKNAAEREAKEASIEYKQQLAQRQSVQQLYIPEKNYNILIKKGIQDLEILENAKSEIIKSLDNASKDSIGRILAEIKTKALNLSEFFEVKLTDKDFYENFEKYYQKNFGEYRITQEEFNKIIKPYIDINLHRIRTLGTKFAYYKAANKLESNIVYLEKVAVKEQNLSL